MKTIQIKGIKLTKSQQLLYDAAHDKEYRYILANYSRQQGKTTVVTLLCLEWLLTPNEDVIYFTPKKNLGKLIYGKLIKLIPEKLVTKSNGTDLLIETVMGSSLKFFSGESAQTARRK